MRRHLFVGILLAAALMALLEDVDANHGTGSLTQTSTPAAMTLEVGSQRSSTSSQNVFIQVQNTGVHPISIFDLVRGSAVANYVYAEPITPEFTGTLDVGSTASLGFRVTAVTNGGASSGTYAIAPQVVTNISTFSLNIPSVTVRDLRAPSPSVTSPISLQHTMACPRPATNTGYSFSVPIRNLGDHPLTVFGLTFSGFPYPVESLDGFGSFTVPPLGTVNRNYRIQLSPGAAEGTSSGTVSVSTNGGSAIATIQLTIVQPVNLLLPPPGQAHDFGDVELTRPSERPFTLSLVETCGYKSVRITVDSVSSLPTYALVAPTVADVFPGQRQDLEINVRFSSAHTSLLLQRQTFQVKLTNTAGPGATYSFVATPVFINIAEARQSLATLATEADSDPGRAAAARMHALLVNRTEVRRPSTQADLEDAARIVTLAEPIALTIQRLDLMLGWNQANDTQRTVADLVALTTGFANLEEVCKQVVHQADRAECEAVLAGLRAELRRLAEESRDRFETITVAGANELERARANAGLALALSALDNKEEAARVAARAQQHFANFTTDLAAAEEGLDQIDERRAASQPGVFIETEGRFVAWHPLGLPLLSAYEEQTERDYATAAARLERAGDAVRLAQLNAEREAFRQQVEASVWVNRLILGAYVFAALLVGAHLLRGWFAFRATGEAEGLGDVVVPEVWAAKH